MKLVDVINEKNVSQKNDFVLEEGVWETVKYALSKLGRYKVGGKIFGKKREEAKYVAKLADILEKTSNQAIKELDALIQKKNPEFPNNKSQEQFLDTVLEIAGVYDSLVAATKLDPKEKGYLPVDAANAIIEDLRVYVQKFLDADLKAAYSVFNEQEELEEDLATKKADVASRFAQTKQDIKKGDIEAYDSERMKTLKSKKLPMTLLGLGASFGGLGWMFEWIAKTLETTEVVDVEQVTKEMSDAVANIKPGEGFTQILNRTMGLNLSINSHPQEVVDAITKIGEGDPKKGVELLCQRGGIFMRPHLAKPVLMALIENPTEHGDTLKDVFSGTRAGTGELGATDTLITKKGGELQYQIESIKKTVIRSVIKRTTSTGAALLIAAPILKIIGIGLVAGAAVTFLARYKGRKSSRAQVLNDLLQTIRPVEATEENPDIVPQSDSANKRVRTGGTEDELYNLLRNYFKEIFNKGEQVYMGSYARESGEIERTQAPKMSRPDDVTTLIKLMEEVNKPFMASINKRASQVDNSPKGLENSGLGKNEIALFRSNVKRLTAIISLINRLKSEDPILNKLMNAAKENIIIKNNIDVNKLLQSDPKSLKIFVSNFNKAIYATQFKNGNSIIDQLKKVGINKLNEVSQRTAPKSDANKVYNLRRVFLSKLSDLLTQFYAIFSYLIDKRRKSAVNESSTMRGGLIRINNQLLKEDIDLINTMVIHNRLIGLIIENLHIVYENNPRRKYGLIQEGDDAKVFGELSKLSDDISNMVSSSYEKKYEQPVNRVKLSEFLKYIFSYMSKMEQDEMPKFFMGAVPGFSSKKYKSLIDSIKDADKTGGENDSKGDIPQKTNIDFTPEKVGGYDLSNLNIKFRESLGNNVKEILKRNNADISQKNVDKVLIELIERINIINVKKIPKINTYKDADKTGGENNSKGDSPKKTNIDFTPEKVGGYDFSSLNIKFRKSLGNKVKEILKRNNADISQKNVDKVLIELIERINIISVKKIPKINT